jgi:hypothetical protein
MSKLLFLTIVILIFSCVQKNGLNIFARQGNNVEKILGAWGNDENGNAIFFIDKDSILYVDPLTKYKYTIVQDTLKIFEYGYVNKLFILKADTDSLVLDNLDYSVIQRYNRRK